MAVDYLLLRPLLMPLLVLYQIKRKNKTLTSGKNIVTYKKETKKMTKKQITLKHKDGRVKTYKSITAFANKHRLSKYHISQILCGNKRRGYFYKGWYDPSPVDNIFLLDDNNNKVLVASVPDFIVKNNLTQRSFNKLIRRQKLYSQGYRHIGTAKPRKKVIYSPFKWTFKDPDGNLHETLSVRKFATSQGLCYRSFYDLGNKTSEYKGWKYISRCPKYRYEGKFEKKGS